MAGAILRDVNPRLQRKVLFHSLKHRGIRGPAFLSLGGAREGAQNMLPQNMPL